MKSEKGVTLASLGIYIVVILIALITLSTITAYFRSNVNEFNTKTTVDLEFDKFNLYFIEEVKKTNNKIDETNSTEAKVVFTSGNTYEFRENSIILNGNVKIAEKIEACTFSFTTNENDIQSVTVYMKVGETERTNEYTLINQIIENVDNEDYIYGAKRIEGTNELVLTNSFTTNLKDYKIYGNSVQDGTPTPDAPVEIKSVGEKTTKSILDKDLSQIGYWNHYINKEGYSPTGVLWSDLTPYVGQSSSSLAWYVTNPIPIKPNTVYSYSGLQTANNPAYIFLEEDMETIINGDPIKGSGTFTTPSNARYIVMSIRNDVIETMNLQEGDTIDYETQRYRIPIKVIGKNLYGGERELTYSTVVNETHKTFYDNFEKGKTYTLFAYIDNTQGTANASFRMSIGVAVEIGNTWQYHETPKLKAGEAGYAKITFTIPENYNGLLNMQYTVTGGTATFKDIMLVEGSYDLNNLPTYETHFEYSTYIYLDEPLRKVGEYADYIDFKEQKVVRYIIEKHLAGEEKWNDYMHTEGMYYTSILKDNIKASSPGLCSHFIWNQSMNDEGQCYVAGKDDSYHNFFLRDVNKFPAQDDLVVFLQENPINFIAVLETPIEEIIELPNIPTYKGTNIIKIDTKISPSNTEVVYYSK